MFKYTDHILARAEVIAKSESPIDEVLEALRHLSIVDFTQFMFSLPLNQYPHISAALPRMADEAAQKRWCGDSGFKLMGLASSFMRVLESSMVRYAGRPLQNADILDFGCGFGRFLRLALYYSNPDRIWGVDVWDKSIEICREHGLKNHFGLSQEVPDDLPVGNQKFDLIFSFSVLTHLRADVSRACLLALRKHIRDTGIAVVTTRPIEFWDFLDQARGTSNADRLKNDFERDGVAFLPVPGVLGEAYGDCSLNFDFFNDAGWRVVGYDRNFNDPYQLACILKPTEQFNYSTRV